MAAPFSDMNRRSMRRDQPYCVLTLDGSISLYSSRSITHSRCFLLLSFHRQSSRMQNSTQSLTVDIFGGDRSVTSNSTSSFTAAIANKTQCEWTLVADRLGCVRRSSARRSVPLQAQLFARRSDRDIPRTPRHHSIGRCRVRVPTDRRRRSVVGSQRLRRHRTQC